MSESSSWFLIIGSNRVDKLTVPLSAVEAEYRVLDGTNHGFLWYFLAFLKTVYFGIHPDCRAIVPMGTRAVGGLSVLAGIITSTPVIARLGGDLWSTHPERLERARTNSDVLEFARYWVICWTDQAILDRCHGLLVVSQSLKERAQTETDIPPNHIEVVHPYVSPTDSIHPTRFEDPETIVCVTNLSFRGKLRGIQDCIEALRPLLESAPDLQFSIAGGGHYLSDLEAFISREHPAIASQINLLGFVDEINEVYAQGDVFVYVSYVDAFPNVVLEAGLAGLPRVVSGVAGLDEQIEDGRTGVVVSPFDETEFRAAVRSLLENPRLAERLRTAAKHDVRENYRPEVIGSDIVSAIDTIAERSS